MAGNSGSFRVARFFFREDSPHNPEPHAAGWTPARITGMSGSRIYGLLVLAAVSAVSAAAETRSLRSSEFETNLRGVSAPGDGKKRYRRLGVRIERVRWTLREVHLSSAFVGLLFSALSIFSRY